MAVYRKPKIKGQRRFGLLPEGVSIRHERKRRNKKTDYGRRLEEKQKLKFIYKILERQLRRYIEEALRSPGDPGEKILQNLETRLDSLVYRLGFAPTRQSARQLVSHGHVRVNGNKVDIPSYQVLPGETITLKERSLHNSLIRESLKNVKPEDLPAWLERQEDVGKLNYLPSKEELPQDINMAYIIELYH